MRFVRHFVGNKWADNRDSNTDVSVNRLTVAVPSLLLSLFLSECLWHAKRASAHSHTNLFDVTSSQTLRRCLYACFAVVALISCIFGGASVSGARKMCVRRQKCVRRAKQLIPCVCLFVCMCACVLVRHVNGNGSRKRT